MFCVTHNGPSDLLQCQEVNECSRLGNVLSNRGGKNDEGNYNHKLTGVPLAKVMKIIIITD